MALRRFQPISPASTWSETLSWRDPRTGQLNSLDGAVLTLALYQRRNRSGAWFWGGDYGWPLHGRGDVPIISAQTQADGSGPFVILPDLLHAQFMFPAGSLPHIHPGDAELIVWANVGGTIDEIERATIPVLDGPRVVPLAVAAVLPPPPTPPVPSDPSGIIDGGEI